MQIEVTKADVTKLIRSFRGMREGFVKQYGSRQAKTALQLWDANREAALGFYWRARSVA